MPSDISKGQATIHKRRAGQRLRWWHLPLLLVAVAVIAVAGVYFHITGRLSTPQGYTSGWSDIAALNSKDVSSSSAVMVSGQASDVVGVNYPIIKKNQIDPDVENILLIGIDGGVPGVEGHRSDTMIVASINSREDTVKLVSMMRDIRAYYPDKKRWDKLNAAYSYGGPGQTVNIINYNFGLDIQKYVVVDFDGFADIIGAMGGIDLSVTRQEANQIQGMRGKPAGTYHLDGFQALAYARIRHIDSDFIRVQRQKKVITTAFGTFKKSDLVKKAGVANTCLSFVKTNISTSEIFGRFMNMSSLISENIQQYTVPHTGLFKEQTVGGLDYLIPDWHKQVNAISQYIYGTDSEYYTALPADGALSRAVSSRLQRGSSSSGGDSAVSSGLTDSSSSVSLPESGE